MADQEDAEAEREDERQDETGAVVLDAWYENTADPSVGELIDYLSQFPPGARVVIDGGGEEEEE